MYVSTVSLNKPTTVGTNYFPKSISYKPHLHSELILCRKIVNKELVLSRKTGRSTLLTLAESSVLTDVCRGSIANDGHVGIGAIEQQVTVDDSVVFRPYVAAGGLESTLNRLVSVFPILYGQYFVILGSKWLLIAFFYTVIIWRHDAKALWLVLGANLNGGLSVTLKKILKQERPSSAFKSDHGMPSTHAQSIFYIVFVANLSIMERLGVNGLSTALAGFLLANGVYFSWLRVSQQFHTISQVVVGALVGSVFAILWFWSWEAFVLRAFNSLLWVRFSVAFGGATFSFSSILYIFQCLVSDENCSLECGGRNRQ